MEDNRQADSIDMSGAANMTRDDYTDQHEHRRPARPLTGDAGPSKRVHFADPIATDNSPDDLARHARASPSNNGDRNAPQTEPSTRPARRGRGSTANAGPTLRARRGTAQVQGQRVQKGASRKKCTIVKYPNPNSRPFIFEPSKEGICSHATLTEVLREAAPSQYKGKQIARASAKPDHFRPMDIFNEHGCENLLGSGEFLDLWLRSSGGEDSNDEACFTMSITFQDA